MKSLLKWVRTIIFHFIAKRVLEIQCRKTVQCPVSVSIIVTDQSSLRFPSWHSICDTIRSAVSSRQHPTNESDKIIEAFKAQVLEVQVGRRDAKLFDGLRHSIRMDNLDDGSAPATYDLVVTLHCEAVLLATALYPSLAILDQDPLLLRIAEVFVSPSSHTVSPSLTLHWQGLGMSPGLMVSKLCCPACCRLFRTIKDCWQATAPKMLTQFHGCHSVPYVVELPKWLPQDVVKNMGNFFTPVLMDALAFLACPPPARLPLVDKVHHSQQSASGISVSSSNAEVMPSLKMLQRLNAELDKEVM